jgi:hypothetical protein
MERLAGREDRRPGCASGSSQSRRTALTWVVRVYSASTVDPKNLHPNAKCLSFFSLQFPSSTRSIRKIRIRCVTNITMKITSNGQTSMKMCAQAMIDDHTRSHGRNLVKTLAALHVPKLTLPPLSS